MSVNEIKRIPINGIKTNPQLDPTALASENLERTMAVEAGRVAAVPCHELSVGPGVMEAALGRPYV